MPEPDETTDDPDLETMFEGWFQERMEREEKKKNRNKDPKNFGEFLDRVADAIWERGEERAAKRRQETDDADQPPARGGSKSAVERWWSGNRDEAAS